MVLGCRSGFCTRTRRIRRTAGRILEQFHLGAATDQLVRSYSSGMLWCLTLLPRSQARVQPPSQATGSGFGPYFRARSRGSSTG